MSTSRDPSEVLNTHQDMAKMSENLHIAESTATEMKELVLRKEDQIEDLKGELARVKDENAMLRHDVSRMHIDLEDRDIKLGVASEENTRKEKMLQSMLDQNSKLKEDLDFHMNESSELLNRLETAELRSKSKIEDLSQKLIVLKLEKDHIKSEQLSLTEDLMPLQNLVTSLKKELEEAKGTITNYEKDRSYEKDLSSILKHESELANCFNECLLENENAFSENLKSLENTLTKKMEEQDVATLGTTFYTNSTALGRSLKSFAGRLRRGFEKMNISQLENTRQLLEAGGPSSPVTLFPTCLQT